MELIYINEVSIIAVTLGGFIVVFGLFSSFIKQRLYLSESLICLCVGVILGPYALRVIQPDGWGNVDLITRDFSRVVIAIQVMATGVALPPAYLRKEFKSLMILIVPVMIWMWIISALSIWFFIPNLSFLEALMIASCVTPTDPVLANSVVTGPFAEKNVPGHVRHIIASESGANDGLGFPFLFFAIYLLQMSPGPAIGKWAYYIMGYQILFSVIIGFVAGYVARKLLRWADERKLVDKEIFMVFAIVLALLVMGAVSLIGSDDILACFIAGNSFNWDDWFRTKTADSHFQELVDLILNFAIFFYLGAIMPWSSFSDKALGLSYWRLIVVAILVLLFRRLPIIMIFLKLKALPVLKTRSEGIFTGWFGPIGVGAVFYAQIAKESFPETDSAHAHARELIIPVVFFLVISSIVVHGLSVPLLKIGKRVNTITISRSQSLERTASILRLRRRFHRATNTSATYTVNSEAQNDLDNSKPIVVDEEQERTPSITTISVLDDNITPDEEQVLPPIPLEANHNEGISRKFSIYEEKDNIIIEDVTDGKIYVVDNPPLPTSATIQETDNNSQRNFNLFPSFKKSSQNQNVR